MTSLIKLTLATAIRLVVAAHSAHGQEYIVNGQIATATQVQYLTEHGIPAGNWQVDGAGYYRVADTTKKNSCWYVLDVLLCDNNESFPVASR